jgi:cytochrome bd ubiquinol oxidase subunit I
VMGLMGYIRSSGRLSWHVSDLMADVSPWAFTPNLEFAAKMVTLNMVVFWGAVFALFWMCQRGQQPVMGEEFQVEKPPSLATAPSQEA